MNHRIYIISSKTYKKKNWNNPNGILHTMFALGESVKNQGFQVLEPVRCAGGAAGGWKWVVLP